MFRGRGTMRPDTSANHSFFPSAAILQWKIEVGFEAD
jgi:hypothetical protein